MIFGEYRVNVTPNEMRLSERILIEFEGIPLLEGYYILSISYILLVYYLVLHFSCILFLNKQ